MDAAAASHCGFHRMLKGRRKKKANQAERGRELKEKEGAREGGRKREREGRFADVTANP